jgi:hypothetical protein
VRQFSVSPLFSPHAIPRAQMEGAGRWDRDARSPQSHDPSTFHPLLRPHSNHARARVSPTPPLPPCPRPSCATAPSVPWRLPPPLHHPPRLHRHLAKSDAARDLRCAMTAPALDRRTAAATDVHTHPSWMTTMMRPLSGPNPPPLCSIDPDLH